MSRLAPPVLFALVLAGCAAPAPRPDPSPAPAVPPAAVVRPPAVPLPDYDEDIWDDLAGGEADAVGELLNPDDAD